MGEYLDRIGVHLRQSVLARTPLPGAGRQSTAFAVSRCRLVDALALGRYNVAVMDWLVAAGP